MIPNNLAPEDIIKAVEEIDDRGIPSHRTSYRYYLVINGKEYPPKYVISVAHRIKTGTEWRPTDFNAVEAKNYFQNRGYTVRSVNADALNNYIADENEESSFSEGKEKFIQHLGYERDTRVSKIAKAKAIASTGELRCEVCNISFRDTYGELGAGYIEAHHKTPVSMLGEDGETAISDIALLCSNCHKMIHRSDPLITVDELNSIYKANNEAI